MLLKFFGGKMAEEMAEERMATMSLPPPSNTAR